MLGELPLRTQPGDQAIERLRLDRAAHIAGAGRADFRLDGRGGTAGRDVEHARAVLVTSHQPQCRDPVDLGLAREIRIRRQLLCVALARGVHPVGRETGYPATTRSPRAAESGARRGSAETELIV